MQIRGTEVIMPNILEHGIAFASRPTKDSRRGADVQEIRRTQWCHIQITTPIEAGANEIGLTIIVVEDRLVAAVVVDDVGDGGLSVIPSECSVRCITRGK